MFRRSRAANSVVGGGIKPKFKIILAFMHILITRKNEDEPLKIEGSRVVTTLHIDFKDTQRQLVVGSDRNQLRPSFITVLVTSKNEVDPIKMNAPVLSL